MLPLRLNKGAAAFVVLLLVGCQAFGSELCASVMDYARLPLPTATVNATNLVAGETYTARTRKDGTTCFTGITEGLYSVEAFLDGFLHVRYYPVRVTASTKQTLSFWLPFGEITEGGLSRESTVSGTLRKGGSPVQSAEVCITGSSGAPKSCTSTNDLGEYALVVPAGVYRASIRLKDGKIHQSLLDLSVPGVYRDRLSFEDDHDRR